jgi:hypothetical protein
MFSRWPAPLAIPAAPSKENNIFFIPSSNNALFLYVSNRTLFMQASIVEIKDTGRGPTEAEKRASE